MPTKSDKLVIICAILIVVFTFICVGFVILRYHPTGIQLDRNNNIVLSTTLGRPDVIPLDSIAISDSPKDIMSNLIRTNGASYGQVRYGYFENTATGEKLFLYLTQDQKFVTFKYNGLIYVTDDWR